jgi:archaellum component FlaC
VAQALSDTTRLSESVDRISRAAESLSRTAEKLPDQFAAERQAILSALDEQSGKLTALSEAIRRTLTAGEQMSTSLNTTLTTFDGLMKRFGVGEPDTTPPDTNSPPFNILDYATTADRVAAMAAELNVVIKDLNTTLDSPALDARLKAVDQVSSRAAADARGLTNHAFLLAAALVVFIFVCAGIYRATRRQTAHRDESA